MNRARQRAWGLSLQHAATLLVLVALLVLSGSAQATSLRSVWPTQNGSASPSQIGSASPNHPNARHGHADRGAVARDPLGRPRVPSATPHNRVSATGRISGSVWPNQTGSVRATLDRRAGTTAVP
jgi:hypothetical protein